MASKEVGLDRRSARGFARWLAAPEQQVAEDVGPALVATLYGSVPLFIAGALNTIVVAAVIAARIPQPRFLIWAALAVLLSAGRTALLLDGRRRIRQGREPAVGLYVGLALGWSAVSGYGAYVSIVSCDWVSGALACLSAGATAACACFRHVAAPRLASAMIALILAPCAIAAFCCGELIMLAAGLQLPVYAAILIGFAFAFHRTLVRGLLAERDNDRRAHHDITTGLLNRAGLGRFVAATYLEEAPFALLALDLDGFKAVNDSFGHETGEALLKCVADRLTSVCAGPDRAVARISGDEFVVVAGVRNEGAAASLGEALLAVLGARPFLIGGQGIVIGASIGVSLYPSHGRELGALLAEADAALYRAKFSGRSRCIIAGSAGSGASIGPRAQRHQPRELVHHRNAA